MTMLKDILQFNEDLVQEKNMSLLLQRSTQISASLSYLVWTLAL
ncbi:hypothetical protein LSPH24S_04142 [Lysinibacillus sphaericus]